MARLYFVSALLVVTSVAVPVEAQVPELVGTWDLTMEVLLGDENLPCVYIGTAEITSQNGAEFAGAAQLQLDSGPASCPETMDANLSGAWVNDVLDGMLDGGDLFGQADFMGSLDQPMQGQTAVPEKAVAGTTYGGPFTVTDGPFAGFSGTWSGVARGLSPLEIPTLGPVGATGLILLLLVGGAWLLVRGRLV